jgi:hypothetical protein
MTTTSERSSTLRTNWFAPVTFGFLILGAFVLLGYSYNYGSSARASATRAEAILTQTENETFCTGLGLAPKTETYVRCETGLTEIRRRQEKQFNDDAMGIL